MRRYVLPVQFLLALNPKLITDSTGLDHDTHDTAYGVVTGLRGIQILGGTPLSPEPAVPQFTSPVFSSLALTHKQYPVLPMVVVRVQYSPQRESCGGAYGATRTARSLNIQTANRNFSFPIASKIPWPHHVTQTLHQGSLITMLRWHRAPVASCRVPCPGAFHSVMFSHALSPASPGSSLATCIFYFPVYLVYLQRTLKCAGWGI